MTFTVDWDNDVSSKIPGNRQVWHGCQILIQEFVESIGGWKFLQDRAENHIPKLQGITEWAEKNHGITIIDTYRARIENHAYLSPNPMDGVDLDVMDWATPYIPYDAFNTAWRPCLPTKDDLRLFMDPVFVGPRSKTDRKFFHSERIKLGLRNKSCNPVMFWRRPMSKCQTPELRRWQEDVNTSRFIFAESGVQVATEWATDRGWKEGRFWSTNHLDVDKFHITLPGCAGTPPDYEKLLFVMRFAGKN